MNKKRDWLWIILMLVVMSGCAAAKWVGEDRNSESAEQQITLHFFHYQSEAEAAYQQVIAAYERLHPNVQILSEFLNSENYNSTLDARIAVRECPDIIGVHPGYAQAIPLASAGYLADLSGQPCLEGIREADLSTASVGGRCYGLPVDVNYICVFYNVDIFEKHGLSVPSTWSDLLVACQTLKQNGYTPISLGYKDTWIQSLIPYSLAVTTIYRDNPDFDANMSAGFSVFNGPEWRRTMQRLKTLINYDYVTKHYMQTTYEQQLYAFACGKAAMTVMNSSSVSVVQNMNPDCRLGLFIMPASDDGVNWIPSSVGGMLAVSEQSAHKEEAIDFLNFFMTHEQIYGEFLRQTGNLPTRSGFTAECDPALQSLLDQIPGSYPFLDVGWPNGLKAVFINTVEQISNGKDIATALQQIDDAWSQYNEKDVIKNGVS